MVTLALVRPCPREAGDAGHKVFFHSSHLLETTPPSCEVTLLGVPAELRVAKLPAPDRLSISLPQFSHYALSPYVSSLLLRGNRSGAPLLLLPPSLSRLAHFCCKAVSHCVAQTGLEFRVILLSPALEQRLGLGHHSLLILCLSVLPLSLLLLLHTHRVWSHSPWRTKMVVVCCSFTRVSLEGRITGAHLKINKYT